MMELYAAAHVKDTMQIQCTKVNSRSSRLPTNPIMCHSIIRCGSMQIALTMDEEIALDLLYDSLTTANRCKLGIPIDLHHGTI